MKSCKSCGGEVDKEKGLLCKKCFRIYLRKYKRTYRKIGPQYKKLPTPNCNKTAFPYVAGYFDGEGYIGIKKYKNHYFLNISVTTCDYPRIKEFQIIFGGGIHKRKKAEPHLRTQWTWDVSHRFAANFLIHLYPFLRTKKEEARVALLFLKYQEENKKREKGNKFSEENLKQKEIFKQVLHRLKRKEFVNGETAKL